jgi:hypothetical protein
MKQPLSAVMLLAASALCHACSSGGSGSGSTTTGTGGTSLTTGGATVPTSSLGGSAGIQQTGGLATSGGVLSSGGATGLGGTNSGGVNGSGGSVGGATGLGGAINSGGATGGASVLGGSNASGGTAGRSGSGGAGGVATTGGSNVSGGSAATGGASGTGGASVTGGSSSMGGSSARGGATGSGGSGTCGAAGSGPIGVLTDPGPGSTGNVAPPNPPGISFKDTDGNLVNAHGGGIIRVCDTFYLHGEYFLSTTTDNDFNGFSMYSSKDFATWKNEGIILPQQSSGELGPNRKGERPHIIKCPSTGEFVLYAHAADVTYQVDKEVIYATSTTVNGKYSYKGPLKNASGATAQHSDMSAFADDTGAYVVTESGHVFTLSSDCHSWVSDKQFSSLNGTTGGIEAPTVFRAGSTYYFIGSDKTGWRANDNFYSTASSMNGPWTYQGYVAPAGKKTWMTQSTWVEPVVGSKGTVYVYWGDHWYGNQDTTNPGVHNYLTTYVFQPLVFSGTAISMPTYQASWKLDVGAGTWSQ